MINKIAHQALTTGYLTLEAENQLRLLLRTQYDSDDLTAFMKLQTAAADGMIR